jgi:hypothetical protein
MSTSKEHANLFIFKIISKMLNADNCETQVNSDTVDWLIRSFVKLL